MKRNIIFLILTSVMFLSITGHARQNQTEEQTQNAIEQLQAITLVSSEGDSINIGEQIRKNPFTLIVMYRGVW